MPNDGPSEGSRRHSIALLPIWFSASVRPTVVVVLPSPAGVGVMADTRINLPFGRSLAACAISMSDLGDWCCEAGIGGPIVTMLVGSLCCDARERGHCVFAMD